MSLIVGQIVAEKYRIIRQIGQGGMGAVYEGENVRIRRRVAIKTLLAQVAGNADVVQRFEREAQAAGRIGSAHIVEVLDLGELPDGTRYMVMEYLEGKTLGERISGQGRIPPREVAPILDQLLAGLEAAHQAGIIHRDLKPANLFLVPGRQGVGASPELVKILDFGVSKFSVLGGEEMSMTRTGAVVGTPYYMSPEQAKGARSIDARADLYSVGVILYEAITGQVPFSADTFNELIFKIVLESPPPPEQFVPNLDPGFSNILKKAMAREASERFQSAGELRAALAAWALAADAAPAPAAPRAAPAFDEPTYVAGPRKDLGVAAFIGMAVVGLSLGVGGFFIYAQRAGTFSDSPGKPGELRAAADAGLPTVEPTPAVTPPPSSAAAASTAIAATAAPLELRSDPPPSSGDRAPQARPKPPSGIAPAPRPSAPASPPPPATTATAPPGSGRPIDENL